MSRNTHAAPGFRCAAIARSMAKAMALAASLVLSGCGTGESLVRQDRHELTGCGGVSAGDRDWEMQRHWQQSKSGADSCKPRKTPRCEVQSGNHVTRYRCE